MIKQLFYSICYLRNKDMSQDKVKNKKVNSYQIAHLVQIVDSYK